MKQHASFLALLATAPSPAAAQECLNPPPGTIFCDDFESGETTGNLTLWDDQGATPSNLIITTASSEVYSGNRALQIPAHKAVDNGDGIVKWFLPGYDQVYVRFYIRFDPNYNYLHHLGGLVASEASNAWSGYGMAGCRPSGSNFFYAGFEPTSGWGAFAPPGAWNFYSYANDMACDPGANCASYADPQAICDQCAARGSPCNNGLECCWGTGYAPSTPLISQRGQWDCLEFMVKANTSGNADGQQTFWMNGAQAGPWSGIRWRTDNALKINSFFMSHYVTDDSYAAVQTTESVWFDNVVVSTSRIGCLSAPPPPNVAPAAPAGLMVR